MLKRSISKIITFFVNRSGRGSKKESDWFIQLQVMAPVLIKGSRGLKTVVIFLRKIDLKTKSTDAFEKNTF